MPPVVSTSTLSPDADRVAILVNPKAGPIAAAGGRPTGRFAGKAAATRSRCLLTWPPPRRRPIDGTPRAVRRTLVGVGGDGTAAELVNRTDEGLPLTLFPGGNSNLLARYLQMTKDPEFLCRTIVEGIVARLDAGRANGRIFLLMIGCGFDAEVVNRVHANRTGHISLKNYFRPVGEALWNYRYPEIQASWEEDEGMSRFRASENGTVPLLRRDSFAFGPLVVRLQFAVLRRGISHRAPVGRLRRPVGRVRIPRRRFLAALGGGRVPSASSHGRLAGLPPAAVADHRRDGSPLSDRRRSRRKAAAGCRGAARAADGRSSRKRRFRSNSVADRRRQLQSPIGPPTARIGNWSRLLQRILPHRGLGKTAGDRVQWGLRSRKRLCSSQISNLKFLIPLCRKTPSRSETSAADAASRCWSSPGRASWRARS